MARHRVSNRRCCSRVLALDVCLLTGGLWRVVVETHPERGVAADGEITPAMA